MYCHTACTAQEPYRFLAIRGSEALISEAGPALHECAADCVPPLRKVCVSGQGKRHVVVEKSVSTEQCDECEDSVDMGRARHAAPMCA